MAVSVIDVGSAHLEQVRPILANYYDSDQSLAGMIPLSKDAQATQYLYRIPFKRWNGGVLAKTSVDGGTIPVGNGMKLSHFTAGFIGSTLAYEVTEEQLVANPSNEGAIVDVLNDMLAYAMTEMTIYDNIFLHCSGNGILTRGASAAVNTGANSTLTFAGTGDYIGVSRLRIGMTVNIYGSEATPSSRRADSGSVTAFQITAINYSTKTVTLDNAAAISGLTTGTITSGDVLTIMNPASDSGSYGPTTLATGSSSWPTAATTSGSGVDGDTWYHGLEYVNTDSSGAAYYLGKSKTTFPQLQAKIVNASSSTITFGHSQLLQNLIFRERDEADMKGMVGVMHQANLRQLKDIGYSIVNIMQPSGQPIQYTDLQPRKGYNDWFDFGGVPCKVSKRCRQDRVDFFIPGNWARVEGFPTRFYGDKLGKTMYEIRVVSGTRAQPSNAYGFAIQSMKDFVCYDPNASGAITSIVPPDGE